MAGKYAVSLYVTAVRANALEPIYEELTELLKASEKSPTFREFLKDMSVSNKNKVKAVQSLLGELGFSDITTNFLGNILSFYIVFISLNSAILASTLCGSVICFSCLL